MVSPAFSDLHQCMFIHVPKTGGTSIEESQLFYQQRIDTQQSIGGHKTAQQLQQDYPEKFERYFTFTFVRNPYARLVSAFAYLAKGGSNPADRRIADQYLAPLGYDFRRFCLEFLPSPQAQKILHLKPQVDFVTQDGAILVDFVGRFEQLAQDFQTVCQHLKIDPIRLAHHRSSRHKPYTDYYDDDIRSVVAQVYQQDLEYWEYEYEIHTDNVIDPERSPSFLINQTRILFNYLQQPQRIKAKLGQVLTLGNKGSV